MIQRINDSVVRHGDVMLEMDEYLSQALEGKKARYFYSDPPWGEGNLKYWQTINFKMNRVAPKSVDLGAFLHQIFRLASTYCSGIVWIEYGVRWRDEIKTLGESYGLKHIGRADIVYTSQNLPLDLHVFVPQGSKEVLPSDYFQRVNGTKGFKTLQAAVQGVVVPGRLLLTLVAVWDTLRRLLSTTVFDL